MQEAEANLKRAQLELDYTEMKAPIAGLISESRVDVVALIQSSETEPLTTISQIDPIYLYFSMSALDYRNARRRVRSWYDEQTVTREGKALEGQVAITLPDDSTYRFQGTVGFTDPKVDPQTGTFAIRAVVPNPEQIVLYALREAADALNNFYKSGEALDAALDLEAASTEYLTLATKRYRNGVLNYLDVLDAQRLLFESQISASFARETQLLALVDLYKALGGGRDPNAFVPVEEQD